MANGLRGVLALFAVLLSGVGCGQEHWEGTAVTTASSGSALNTTLKDSQFSDANGWNAAPYYSTIDFPDINGDSASDVCGRGIDGVWCAVDDGMGHLLNDSLWQSSFSDANGWTAPQHYSTIQFANVDGDTGHKADLCARGTAGILCAVSNATAFGAANLWQASFSDANGWAAPEHYSTIRFPDLNGDGKADVCGRGVSGIVCALSSGSAFGTLTTWNSAFSDAAGWTASEYYSTIRFPDVNGDGKADVCGRGTGGIWCALSSGTSFSAATLWESSFSDANGWAAPEYNSTFQYSDINNDGKADLCGRGIGGILCALSTGSSFAAPTVWNDSFSDANGWNSAQYYSTIRIQKNVLCGRGVAGILCAHSNQSNGFAVLSNESQNESDANGWTQPQYYRTIRVTSDLKIAARGSAGIYTTPVFPTDKLSITSVAALNARRMALINKVWARSTVDTTQGVDDDSPPATVDVSPLPPGTTVRRYKINMPTQGGSPFPSGPARVQGLADHFIPAGGSTKLAILNPGHACKYSSYPHQDSETVTELLANGYAVLATYMPLFTPLECNGDHDSLFDPSRNLRPENNAHPLIYFLDPVRRSLNYAIQNYGYTQVNMAGLSGGGWTTTLYAALDTRVTTSVPIAGTEPFYMRSQSDAEQEDKLVAGNDFFNFPSGSGQVVTGYKDLYLLGSFPAGRKQVQVLNRNDDCCFGQYEYKGIPTEWGPAVRGYEVEVRSRLQLLGAGSFRVEINEADDPGFFRHEFSRNTRVNVILAEFEGKHSVTGASGVSTPFARGANGHLWRNTSGTTWADTGLSMVGTPAVVSGAISGHTFDVFYRDPSNRPVHAFFNGSTWQATSDLSGVIISDPSAISWGPGRIDVVALGGDYRLYHWKYDGSWTPYELVHPSAQGVGPIALTASGVNRLDIFFRGLDAGLYHIASNGAAPFTLENTGQFMRSFPAATAIPGTLLAYVNGTSDRLLQGKQVNGGAWSWTDIASATGTTGTRDLGSPAVFRASDGTINAYTRIAGNQVGVFTFANSSWSFRNPGGEQRVASPSANSVGAFAIDPSNQSAFQLDTLGWHSLGGFLER
jgi:hypothetical protein